MYRVTNIEANGRAYTQRTPETKRGRRQAEDMFNACVNDPTVICAVLLDGSGYMLKSYNVGCIGVHENA